MLPGQGLQGRGLGIVQRERHTALLVAQAILHPSGRGQERQTMTEMFRVRNPRNGEYDYAFPVVTPAEIRDTATKLRSQSGPYYL